MLDKLAAQFRNSDVNYRLLGPLLVSSFLIQMVTALVRVTISYRAVELGLSIIWLGFIAASFAIFPILIAVRVGRFIDRGHDALTSWVGAAIFLVSIAGFAVWATPTGLLVLSAIMGLPHGFWLLRVKEIEALLRIAGDALRETVDENLMAEIKTWVAAMLAQQSEL